MKYGSCAIQYVITVLKSTEVRNYVVELCSYLVEGYGDVFLNRTPNLEDGNLSIILLVEKFLLVSLVKWNMWTFLKINHTETEIFYVNKSNDVQIIAEVWLDMDMYCWSWKTNCSSFNYTGRIFTSSPVLKHISRTDGNLNFEKSKLEFNTITYKTTFTILSGRCKISELPYFHESMCKRQYL